MNTSDILKIAEQHSLTTDCAAPDFFEGALLGNGGLGVNICTRPDAIVLYFGHNNIWDIRIEEGHKDKIRTFDEIWGKIRSCKTDVHEEAWYQKYVEEVTASYHDYLYPRPYPASSLALFYDRKAYEMLGYSLNLSNGCLTISMKKENGQLCRTEVFVSQTEDLVYLRSMDETGKEIPVFYRMKLIPHTPDGGLPAFEVRKNGFFQLLPYNGYEGTPRPGIDHGFSVWIDCNESRRTDGLDTRISDMTHLTVQITEGTCEKADAAAFTAKPFDEAFAASRAEWESYWSRSGVRLDDFFLEHLWYVNTYLIRCILREDTRCPGLFANWMFENIGTAWHGDYHMNYNTQQVFWGLFGANRMEQHMPYLRLAEDLLPVSRAWAKDFYHLDGACFPHSAYPVPMQVVPYPSPDWGWEIFETPWTVQSLWWHYTYTKDLELLKNRIYPVLRAAACFLVGYMTRDGANPNGDDLCHLFPTIVPELYGLTDGFRLNLDGAVDLTFTKFVFRAVLQAVADLGIEAEETELTDAVRKILAAFPAYPTAESRRGKVYVSVQNEDPDTVVYNCPANLMQVFPGEDIDAQSATPEEFEIAARSWKWHYNEGGNDLVFYAMIGARLGILDMEQFKRHVRYCLLPNGTAFDRATLAGGRYSFETNLSYMGHMGIWIENFSLYAVVDECLLRGHTDLIELFPCWDKQTAAAFHSLRTKGAFLIDAACEGGEVTSAQITSERGGILRMKNPWKSAVSASGQIFSDAVITCSMQEGETLSLSKAL